jgi:hypothetical protein
VIPVWRDFPRRQGRRFRSVSFNMLLICSKAQRPPKAVADKIHRVLPWALIDRSDSIWMPEDTSRVAPRKIFRSLKPSGINSSMVPPTEHRIIYPPSFVIFSNPFIIETSINSSTGRVEDVSFPFAKH